MFRALLPEKSSHIVRPTACAIVSHITDNWQESLPTLATDHFSPECYSETRIDFFILADCSYWCVSLRSVNVFLNEYMWIYMVLYTLAVNETYSMTQLRSVTCHMGSHSVTCHPTQVNTPRLNPARQAATQFTSPGGMEGWVDLGDLLHTEMVCPPADGHPSKFYDRCNSGVC